MSTQNNSNTSNIAEILKRLDGRIEVNGIKFSQLLLNEQYRETGVNDIFFIKKMHGVYFYTSRYAMEQRCRLQDVKMPIYVGIDGTLSLYEIE